MISESSKDNTFHWDFQHGLNLHLNDNDCNDDDDDDDDDDDGDDDDDDDDNNNNNELRDILFSIEVDYSSLQRLAQI